MRGCVIFTTDADPSSHDARPKEEVHRGQLAIRSTLVNSNRAAREPSVYWSTVAMKSTVQATVSCGVLRRARSLIWRRSGATSGRGSVPADTAT